MRVSRALAQMATDLGGSQVTITDKPVYAMIGGAVAMFSAELRMPAGDGYDGEWRIHYHMLGRAVMGWDNHRGTVEEACARCCAELSAEVAWLAEHAAAAHADMAKNNPEQ